MKTTYAFLFFSLLMINLSCKNNTEDKSTQNETIAEVLEEPIKEKSLFERLGGTEGIASIVDTIINNHKNNPVVSDKFAHLKPNTEAFELFKKHVNEFIIVGTGGEGTYTGKDMVSAHAEFNITEKEFLNVTDDVLDALDSHNIDDQTKKDMLYILYSLKDPIIRK